VQTTGRLRGVLDQQVDEPGVPIDQPLRERRIDGLEQPHGPAVVRDDQPLAVASLLE
jgi:hypothetical protein